MSRKKKIEYQLGDVFLVPLKNGLYGVGRIMRRDLATILVEMYRIKPIKDEGEYCYKEMIKQPSIMLSWMYNTPIKSGEWKIIDNRVVPEKIDMPYYSYRDCGDKKWYIKKGTETSFNTVGKRIEIPEEDKFKYEFYGIGGAAFQIEVYMRRLCEAGLITDWEEEDTYKENITNQSNSLYNTNVADKPKPRDLATGIVNKFDTEYKLLADMYDDDYYPDNLVGKIKALMEKLIAYIETGERDIEKVQEKLDEMTLGINDLEQEFDENDSEIETMVRDIIGVTVDYILAWFEIDIDGETAIRMRNW